MEQHGTIMVHAFTSRAQLPVAGATIVISQQTEEKKHMLYAVRVTNENGEIPPVQVPTPMGSRNPGTETPYTLLDVWVEHPGYQLELIRNAQVFSGTDSVLEVALIPLAEHAIPRNSFHIVNTTPQSL